MCSNVHVYDVVIVGGGLSGLVVANEIRRIEMSAPESSCLTKPLTWKLLESRPALGGRLQNDQYGNSIDMGGAWIWPRHQPLMSGLVSSLGIPTFPQPDDADSTRVEGGAVQIVQRLAGLLPPDRLQLESAVTSCKLERYKKADGTVEPVVCLETSSSDRLRTRKVVFAVPPKILSTHVRFDPPLSDEKKKAMENSQTWMAGVTKVALVFQSRFWPLDGVASNMGLRSGPTKPAFQVYDASTRDEKVIALTFFTLVDSKGSAAESDDVLAKQCSDQMEEVWSRMGMKTLASLAGSFTSFHVKRWPLERYVSEDPTPHRVNPHPHPVRALASNEWNGMLLFAGTETDQHSPGVMEGAVGAALRVVKDELSSFFGTGS